MIESVLIFLVSVAVAWITVAGVTALWFSVQLAKMNRDLDAVNEAVDETLNN